MSRSTALLVTFIVLLTGALMFVIGRATGSDASSAQVEAALPEQPSKALSKTHPSVPQASMKPNDQPNGARQGDGWNCDSHGGMADSLGLEGYRLVQHEKSANGQDIEIWRNITPPEARKPGRDDIIRVQHSANEDCVIVESNTKNG